MDRKRILRWVAAVCLLVLTTDKPLRSGTVVSILNPEVWQE